MVSPPSVGEEARSYEVLSPDKQKLLMAMRKLSIRRCQGLLALLDVHGQGQPPSSRRA